jgi:uncharacterized protein YdhG (YjbR/CyaY superfamily)
MRIAKSSSRKSPKGTKSVPTYLASLPADSRREINKMRAAIRAAAPAAVEGISYSILGFKLDGRILVYCAGWAKHTSLYPLTPAIRRAHATELERYETSKGTVRFPLDKPLPTGFVKRLVKTRVAEMRAKENR